MNKAGTATFYEAKLAYSPLPAFILHPTQDKGFTFYGCFSTPIASTTSRLVTFLTNRLVLRQFRQNRLMPRITPCSHDCHLCCPFRHQRHSVPHSSAPPTLSKASPQYIQIMCQQANQHRPRHTQEHREAQRQPTARCHVPTEPLSRGL